MKLKELNDQTLEDPGDWPLVIKILVFLILAAAIIGAGYYFDVKEQYLDLDQVVAKEQRLRDEFERKQA